MNRNDTVICGELCTTLSAVFDLAVAASSPSTGLDEALRLRRTARGQLDFCARLLHYLNRSRAAGGKIDPSGAAAAGSSDLADVAPSALSEEASVKSDEPGFQNPMPGTAGVSHADSFLQGTAGAEAPGMYQDGGPPLATVPVSHIFDSNVANVPMVAVHAEATNSAADPMLDAVSKTRTPPAVPAGGRVIAPRGPGAGGHDGH